MKNHDYLNVLILTALNFPWIQTTVSSYDGKIFLDYDATRVHEDALSLEVLQMCADLT